MWRQLSAEMFALIQLAVWSLLPAARADNRQRLRLLARQLGLVLIEVPRTNRVVEFDSERVCRDAYPVGATERKQGF